MIKGHMPHMISPLLYSICTALPLCVCVCSVLIVGYLKMCSNYVPKTAPPAAPNKQQFNVNVMVRE